jgi:hypothetical protein
MRTRPTQVPRPISMGRVAMNCGICGAYP